MFYDGAKFELWHTPISNEGYESIFVTEGFWKRKIFSIPIDCSRKNECGWEKWVCTIEKPIWVRVVMDELYDVAIDKPERPASIFVSPFYRIIGSRYAPICEEFLRATGVLKTDQPVSEFLIASSENEIHILSTTEPTFRRLEISDARS